MNRSSEHTALDFTATLPAADFIARFRDPERIAAYCRACPNYGRSWACPPFGFDMDDYLAGYRTALIIATKITPSNPGLPFREAGRLFRPERVRHESRLLDMGAQRHTRTATVHFSYRFGGYKERRHKEVDTSRFGH